MNYCTVQWAVFQRVWKFDLSFIQRSGLQDANMEQNFLPTISTESR